MAHGWHALRHRIQGHGPILLASSLACLIPAPCRPQALAGVDQRIQEALASSGVPGLAVVVVHGDSVLLSRGFGTRRLGGTEPVDAQTLFQVASLSKAVTAAAVGLLVDEGKVGWDDPVRKHVPEFALADPWVTEHFTIRDALAMRDGIPGGDSVALFTDRTPRQILARTASLDPTLFRATYGAAPNLDYFLVGEVIARASGKSWAAFVEERLFRPLGMSSTTTVLADAVTSPNMAAGHARVQDRFQVTPYRNVENVAAAAGMITNVADLSKWLRFHLAQGTIDGRQILSTEALVESYRPQNILTPAYQAMFNPEGLLNAYGFGWVLSEYRGVTLIEHAGALPGFGAVIAMVPERNVGLALLSNVSLAQSIRMLQQLKFELLGRFLDADTRGGPTVLPPGPASAQVDGREVRTVPSADGVPIEYEAAGLQQPGVPIVFVHGFSNNRSFWEPHFSAMAARGHPVAALDLAGFGQSGAARRLWGMEAFGDDVAAVLADLDLRSAVLVGFSMGAAVVLEAALEAPERVAGVVLIDWLQDPEQRMGEASAAQFREWFSANWRKPTLLAAAPPLEEFPDSLFQRYLRSTPEAMPEHWTPILAGTLRWADERARSVLDRIEVPVAAINSDAVATNVEYYRSNVPSFELRLMPGLSHLGVIWQHTEQFDRHLEELVKGMRSARNWPQ